MRNALLFLVSGILASTPFAAPTSDSLFAVGNAAYDEGNYELAIEAYEGILATDIWDGHVLYNLGNAHHKAGDLGRAILSYERALRIMPRSQDLRENLDYLRVLRKDRLEDDTGSAVAQAVDRLVHSLALDEASAILLSLWILLGLLVSARIVTESHERRQALGRMATGCLIVFVGSAIHVGMLWSEARRDDGIVVQEEVGIRSGPGTEYVTEFELHAGIRVTVQRKAGDWIQVALSDELHGWCPAEAVDHIRVQD